MMPVFNNTTQEEDDEEGEARDTSSGRELPVVTTTPAAVQESHLPTYTFCVHLIPALGGRVSQLSQVADVSLELFQGLCANHTSCCSITTPQR